MMRRATTRLAAASRVSSSLAVRRFVPRLISQRSCVASASIRAYATHAGLSNAAFHELQEEQSRTDKQDQPVAPNGWNIVHTPGNAKFRLTRSFEDEQLEIRCQLPSQKPQEADAADSASGFIGDVALIVQKGSEGMRFGLSIEDSELVLDNVSHFKDAAAAKDDTPAGVQAREGHYPGPLVHELDSNFVEQFLSYLEARGVNDELASFLVEFSFWKEQQEYESWLNSVGNFTR